MTWIDEVAAAFGAEAVRSRPGETPVVAVDADGWHDAVVTARTTLACDYFDFLTVSEEPAGGFRVVCHLAHLEPRALTRLLLQTTVPRDDPRVVSVADVFAGAAWHEREMREMYGVVFEGGDPRPLLLTGEAGEHPMRKEVLLPARSARPWPGAKEPGESDAAAEASPSRRRLRPPGVPEVHGR